MRFVHADTSRPKPISDLKIWEDDALVFYFVLPLPSVVHASLSVCWLANREHSPIDESNATELGPTTFAEHIGEQEKIVFTHLQVYRRLSMRAWAIKNHVILFRYCQTETVQTLS